MQEPTNLTPGDKESVIRFGAECRRDEIHFVWEGRIGDSQRYTCFAKRRWHAMSLSVEVGIAPTHIREIISLAVRQSAESIASLKLAAGA